MPSISYRSTQLVEPCQVFMTNVSKCTQKEIQKEFSKYADIKSVYLKVRKFCFINTVTEEGAQRILSQNKENNEFVKRKGLILKVSYKKLCLPGDEGYRPVSLDNCLAVAEDETIPTIHMLNDDVLLHILSFLSPKNVIRLSGVCKRFGTLCNTVFCDDVKVNGKNDPLSYIGSICRYKEIACCKAINVLGENLKSVWLHDSMVWFDEDCRSAGRLIRTLESSCHSLEKLQLDYAWNLRKLLQRNPQLKSIRMYNVPHSEAQKMVQAISQLENLQNLSLKDFEALNELVEIPMPSVKNLELEDDSLDTPRGVSIQSIVKWCPNLHSLGIYKGIIPSKTIDYLKISLPHLQSLSFATAQPPPTETFPSIKALHIRDLGTDHMESTMERFPNIETFVLSAHRGPFLNLDHHYAQLKELYVYAKRMGEDQSIVNSLKKCQQLEILVFYSLSLKDVLRVIKELPRLKLYECNFLQLESEDVDKVVKLCQNRTPKLYLNVDWHYLSEEESARLKTVCRRKEDHHKISNLRNTQLPSFIDGFRIEEILQDLEDMEPIDVRDMFELFPGVYDAINEYEEFDVMDELDGYSDVDDYDYDYDYIIDGGDYDFPF